MFPKTYSIKSLATTEEPLTLLTNAPIRKIEVREEKFELLYCKHGIEDSYHAAKKQKR